jgi:hypothetical protein
MAALTLERPQIRSSLGIRSTRSRRLSPLGSARLCALAVAAAALLSACGSQAPQLVHTRTCVYSANLVDKLPAFDRLVSARVTCALVFDTEQPTWATWEDPWFITSHIKAENWTSFARRPGDLLIITVPLIPDQAVSQNWRLLGAQGAYDAYDRTLARNLIANGLGRSIIRLAHEANGTWAPDNVGDTPAQWAEWRQFWVNTVLAMDSVPGAHFSFNWCIAGGYRALPFKDYYPGDAVVDSIGVDVYDMGEPKGIPPGPRRWTYQYDRPGGIAAIAAFAKAHHKPLSIPEWGLEPTSAGGAGDDAAFVRGLAKLLRTTDVAFESYFDAEGSAAELTAGSASLEAYRAMIGVR